MTRADRAAVWLAERDIDALLVTDLVNLRYLTGFTGSSGLALIGGGEGQRLFVTDFRYVSQSAEQVDPDFEHRIATGELFEALAPALEPAAMGQQELRLGFDDAPLSVKSHERLQAPLPA